MLKVVSSFWHLSQRGPHSQEAFQALVRGTSAEETTVPASARLMGKLGKTSGGRFTAHIPGSD